MLNPIHARVKKVTVLINIVNVTQEIKNVENIVNAVVAKTKERTIVD